MNLRVKADSPYVIALLLQKQVCAGEHEYHVAVAASAILAYCVKDRLCSAIAGKVYIPPSAALRSLSVCHELAVERFRLRAFFRQRCRRWRSGKGRR